MDFPTISKEYPLLLASASPRRKRLLEQIGLPYRALSGHVEEDPIPGNPSLTARLLAEGKARAAYSVSENNWILGADTVVALGESLLGKPGNHEEALYMLSSLSGKEHQVVTGFCLLDPSGGIRHSETITTLVKMKKLTKAEIAAYVATGEPFGKAGSYAIQGIGAFMVESISGSYTNVVGLPVCALIKALLATGALANFPLTSSAFYPSRADEQSLRG